MASLADFVVSNRKNIKQTEENLANLKREKEKLLRQLLEILLPNPKAHKNFELFSDFLLQFCQGNDPIKLQIRDEKGVWDSKPQGHYFTINDFAEKYRPFFKILDDLGFEFETTWVQSGPMGDLQNPEIQIMILQ